MCLLPLLSQKQTLHNPKWRRHSARSKDLFIKQKRERKSTSSSESAMAKLRIIFSASRLLYYNHKNHDGLETGIGREVGPAGPSCHQIPCFLYSTPCQCSLERELQRRLPFPEYRQSKSQGKARISGLLFDNSATEASPGRGIHPWRRIRDR